MRGGREPPFAFRDAPCPSLRDHSLTLYRRPRRPLPALRRGTSLPGLPDAEAGLREPAGSIFAFADSADGPAFFIMSIVGILVVGLALGVEFAYEPPIWLHLVMWSALAIVLSLALARPAKGLMIALQYHHRAEEGRLER